MDKDTKQILLQFSAAHVALLQITLLIIESIQKPDSRNRLVSAASIALSTIHAYDELGDTIRRIDG
jgi:hypothetical protein